MRGLPSYELDSNGGTQNPAGSIGRLLYDHIKQAPISERVGHTLVTGYSRQSFFPLLPRVVGSDLYRSIGHPQLSLRMMAPTFMGVLAFGGDEAILITVLDLSGPDGAAGRGLGYPPDLFRR